MWNNWVEAGKSIAEKAKEAAEGIEAQLNDSVGLPTPAKDDDQKKGFENHTNNLPMDKSFKDSSIAKAEDELNDPFFNDEVVIPGSGTKLDFAQVENKEEVVEETSFDDDDNSNDGHNYAYKPQQESIFRADTSNNAAQEISENESLEEDIPIEQAEGSGWNMDDDDIMLSQDEDQDLDENIHVEQNSEGGIDIGNSQDENLDEPQEEVDNSVVPDFDTSTDEPIDTLDQDETTENETQPSAKTENDIVNDATDDAQTSDIQMQTEIPLEEEAEEVKEVEVEEEEEEETSPKIPDERENLHEKPALVQSNIESQGTVESDDEEKNKFIETSVESQKIIYMKDETIAKLQRQSQNLQKTLNTREEQLEANSNQMATLQNIFESEKESLMKVIKETKEEAKKRLIKSKERVEDMQERCNSTNLELERLKKQNEKESVEKDTLITELRNEGENLAKTQGKSHESVRKAQKEVKALKAQVEDLIDEQQRLQDTVAAHKERNNDLTNKLALANKEKERALNLTKELSSTKEASQQHEAMKLALEQEIKELKKSHLTFKKEVSEREKAQTSKLDMEQKSILNEKEEFMKDMETKLRAIEKESNLREDALRRELEDLRKRWQDSVQRADVLSMDVQQSTAPLIRQLESTERTNRLRSAVWMEMEQNLRSDIEELVVKNEKLTISVSTLQSDMKKSESELKAKKSQLEIITNDHDNLLDHSNTLAQKLEEATSNNENLKVEMEAKDTILLESSTKIRNEMMTTVMDNEARQKEEVEELCKKLERSINERQQLEDELGLLMQSANSPIQSKMNGKATIRNVTDQASILESTLSGLDTSYENGEDFLDNMENTMPPPSTTSSSFVAMEHLSQTLKASKVELKALRKQLSLSENSREELQEELSSARVAAEKLPFFVERVNELTLDLEEKRRDIGEARENMLEVKEMFRSQLDSLLEEKVANEDIEN